MPKCFRGSFANKTQNSSKNSKPFWTLRLGRGSYEQLVSNSERFRDIQHSMSTVLDPGFHIWFIMALYYKMRQMLLQNATAILLQNATEVYYKMCQVFYYKMRQFYYKMGQLLQIATNLLQNATVITICYVYYKLRQYILLQLIKCWKNYGIVRVEKNVRELHPWFRYQKRPPENFRQWLRK